jgi:hypothetical protein
MTLFVLMMAATAVAGAMIERRTAPRSARGARPAIVVGAPLAGVAISLATSDGGQFALLGFALAIGFGVSWARSAALSVTGDRSAPR